MDTVRPQVNADSCLLNLLIESLSVWDVSALLCQQRLIATMDVRYNVCIYPSQIVDCANDGKMNH